MTAVHDHPAFWRNDELPSHLYMVHGDAGGLLTHSQLAQRHARLHAEADDLAAGEVVAAIDAGVAKIAQTPDPALDAADLFAGACVDAMLMLDGGYLPKAVKTRLAATIRPALAMYR